MTHPTTNILDVLPDGTIMKLSFSIPAAMTIMLCKSNIDELFIIEFCKITTTDDEKILTETVESIQFMLRKHTSTSAPSDNYRAFRAKIKTLPTQHRNQRPT